jgi:hypothetical protein
MAIVAKRIGELLVEAGVLSQSQLEQALFAQRKDGRKLGQLLIELGLVSEIQLTQTLSRQLSVPWVSLYHVDFSRSLLNLVAREAAEKYCLVPIFVRRVRKQGETLYVAMDDPTNEGAIEDVARAAAMPVKPMIACPSDIRAAIRVYYLGEAAPPPPAPGSAPQVTQLAPPPAASPPSPPQMGSPRGPGRTSARDRSAGGGGSPREAEDGVGPRLAGGFTGEPRADRGDSRGRVARTQAHAAPHDLAHVARRDVDLHPCPAQQAAVTARREREARGADRRGGERSADRARSRERAARSLARRGR